MYISLIPVPEDEIAAGEKKFTERMAPVMDDPWGFINKDKAKLTSTIERVWPVNLEHMDDFELWRYVYIDKMDLVHVSEQYHFMVMRGLSSAFALFRQLCAELFGIRPHDITFAEQSPPIRDWLRSHREEWNRYKRLGPPGATKQVPPFIGDMSALGEILVGGKGRATPG